MTWEPSKWEVRDSTLANGMRLLVLEDHRSPLVSVQLWYHVGSKDEHPDRQGFAHLFEHMMFRGTNQLGPQDHFKYLQQFGSQVNGYTSFDMTVYWETVPASQLDLALWLEAERMANLKISEEYFAAEREVVKEEMRMRNLNRPYGQLYDRLMEAAFRHHPYRWTVIGQMAHLDAATTEELREFFRTYYTPNNCTLVLVGDIPSDDAQHKVERYFGSIPAGPTPPRVAAIEPAQSESREVHMTDPAPSPLVLCAYRSMSAVHPNAVALNVLARILGGGQSSRLYCHLVRGRQIAVSISADDFSLEQDGLLLLSATLKSGISLEEGEQALREQVRDLLKNGLEPGELDKARNQALAEHVVSSESVQGKASQLGYATVILGDPHRVHTDLIRLREITTEQVMQVAHTVLTEARCTTVKVASEPASSRGTDQQSTRGEQVEKTLTDLPVPPNMPQGQSPQPVDLPIPEKFTLSNGIKLYVFSDDSVPSVSLSLNLLTGGRDDPSVQEGLACVTARCLRRGTKRSTADEIAKRIDSHGMRLRETIEYTNTQIRLWTLSEHVELAMGTLAELVREPTFPEQEIQGFLARSAAAEALREADFSTLASREFAKHLFGQHYLARPVSGTSTSLKTLERGHLAAFHQQWYQPAVASLCVAGDISGEVALKLAEQHFGSWSGSSPAPSVAAVPPESRRDLIVVDRPQAVQTEIRLGHVVPLNRRAPQYPAARMLSQILGESFSARLNRVLRIEKGLTYGVRGAFEVNTELGAFRVSTFTRPQKVAEAIQAILREIGRIRSEPVTAEEMTLARDALIGGFQMGLETPSQIADRYWDLVVWDLPEDWYRTYQQQIQALADPTALQSVANLLLNPDRMAILIVARADEVQASLRFLQP